VCSSDLPAYCTDSAGSLEMTDSIANLEILHFRIIPSASITWWRVSQRQSGTSCCFTANTSSRPTSWPQGSPSSESRSLGRRSSKKKIRSALTKLKLSHWLLIVTWQFSPNQNAHTCLYRVKCVLF